MEHGNHRTLWPRRSASPAADVRERKVQDAGKIKLVHVWGGTLVTHNPGEFKPRPVPRGGGPSPVPNLNFSSCSTDTEIYSEETDTRGEGGGEGHENKVQAALHGVAARDAIVGHTDYRRSQSWGKKEKVLQYGDGGRLGEPRLGGAFKVGLVSGWSRVLCSEQGRDISPLEFNLPVL